MGLTGQLQRQRFWLMEKEMKTSPQALCSLLCLKDESESGEKILYCQERTGTT